jgi:lysophospholipase L1-like esterase
LRLTPPRTRLQALRLVAAVLTVILVVLLGGLGSRGPERPTYRHYVALGDSYTSAPFVPLTDVARGCFRSSNNYPHLVAQALHIDDLQDRSCSGAQTHHLPGPQLTSPGTSVAPQFAALSADTDLVTVSIGVNNGGLYARIATVCRKLRTTCRLHDQRETLGAIVDRLRPELVSTLEQVEELAPDARVLLISYPMLLPPRGNCGRLPHMRSQDRATFRTINLRLRDEMRAAADETRVEFVDFYRASLGHDVCSRHPYVQGRVGHARRGAALHPLASGQAAVARLVVEVLRRDSPEAAPYAS